MARQVEHHRLVDLQIGRVGQQFFQRFEPAHQFFEPLVRDRGGLGGERRGERIVQALDVFVLLVGRHAGVQHAVAQRLEQRRQAPDHLGALLARDLGAGRPDQVGGGTLHLLGGVALVAALDRGHRQHVGPDVEQELAHALLHRHLVEHLAQLDRVLDRQRLALLDLLRQRHALARGFVLVLEIVLEELLEFDQHGLEHAPAGVRVGLDDLHHALDLFFERVADRPRGGVETHHARAHAVDQAARRVVDGREEVRLADGHPQHRHLQPREPDPHRRRNALFGQDALEQQRDDLDRGALHRRGRGLLQRLLAVVQFFEQRRRADRIRRRCAPRHRRRPTSGWRCPAGRRRSPPSGRATPAPARAP